MKITRQLLLITAVALASLTLTTSSGFAAGFDCTKARKISEKFICSNPKLSDLDDQLSAKYLRLVKTKPELKMEEINWLKTIRDRCDNEECLFVAYQNRLNELTPIIESLPNESTHQVLDATMQQPLSAETRDTNSSVKPVIERSSKFEPVAPNVATQSNNPLEILIEPKSFIGNSLRTGESFWSWPDQTLYGKRTIDWTEQDFQLLEQKLQQQIIIERNEAIERMKASRGQEEPLPEKDATYLSLKRLYEEAIGSIPRFKLWSSMGREKEQARLEKIALEEKQRKDEQLIAEQQRQQQQDSRAREEKKRKEEVLLRQQQEQESLKESAQIEAERQDKQKNLSLFLLVIAAAVGGWIWNKFIRLRCPKCKSPSPEVLEINEIDRWRGTKKVTENHSRGSRSRHVSTTYVKNEYHYRCRTCNHVWIKIKKEEL